MTLDLTKPIRLKDHHWSEDHKWLGVAFQVDRVENAFLLDAMDESNDPGDYGPTLVAYRRLFEAAPRMLQIIKTMQPHSVTEYEMKTHVGRHLFVSKETNEEMKQILEFVTGGIEIEGAPHA